MSPGRSISLLLPHLQEYLGGVRPSWRHGRSGLNVEEVAWVLRGLDDPGRHQPPAVGDVHGLSLLRQVHIHAGVLAKLADADPVRGAPPGGAPRDACRLTGATHMHNIAPDVLHAPGRWPRTLRRLQPSGPP